MTKKKEKLVEEQLPVEENTLEIKEEQPVVEQEVKEEEKVEICEGCGKPVAECVCGSETPEEESADGEEPADGEESVDPEKVIEEFNESAKKIDDFVRPGTTQEELSKKLFAELKHAEEVQEKVEKQIEKIEEKIEPKVKKTFSEFWMGSSDGWFN